MNERHSRSPQVSGQPSLELHHRQGKSKKEQKSNADEVGQEEGDGFNKFQHIYFEVCVFKFAEILKWTSSNRAVNHSGKSW